MKLSGNTILITGGASGIGFELAKELLKTDNTVIITGRDQAKLEKAKTAFPKLHTLTSDVTKTENIAQLFQTVTSKFPALNMLINNAGIMREINLQKSGDLNDITREIETNLNGPIRMIAQFLPHLQKQAEAAIVNVTSGLAFVPLPTSPVYCATKAGLRSYTMSLRVQLANTTVKVFELAPPATQTELLTDFDSESMKGVSIMPVEDMVEDAIAAFRDDRFEIRPGQSNQLKFISRLAPDFAVKMMSGGVNKLLGTKQ